MLSLLDQLAALGETAARIKRVLPHGRGIFAAAAAGGSYLNAAGAAAMSQAKR